MPLGSDRKLSLLCLSYNLTAHRPVGLQGKRPTLSSTVPPSQGMSKQWSCLSASLYCSYPIHPSPPHSYCGFSEAPFEDSPRQLPCTLTLSQNLQEHSSHTPEKWQDPLHCWPALEVFFVLSGCAQEGHAVCQSTHHEAPPTADTPPETQ